MKASDLNRRVTIQRLVEVGKTELEEPITDWQDVCTVWAKVEPLQGREYWAARRVNGEVSTRVTIRYRPGLDNSMRLKHGDRVLELVSPPINIGERDVELQLLCKEVT